MMNRFNLGYYSHINIYIFMNFLKRQSVKRGTESSQNSLKDLHSCSEDEQKFYRFETT